MTIAHTPYPGTQAVLRAVALLKAFSDARPELSLTELARAVGLNKTTAYRMLTALESEGMVLRHPQTGAYRLGPGVIELGGRAVRASDLPSIAHAELHALAAQSGETVTLEILSGEQVLILAEIQSAHRLTGAQSVGTVWPLHATSTGKAILACLPDKTRAALIQPPLHQFTSTTVTNPEALLAELNQVRQQGYSTAIDEIETGYSAVGAAILNVNGEPAGAISVGGPTSRLTRGRLIEVAALVTGAAARISQQLGYHS